MSPDATMQPPKPNHKPFWSLVVLLLVVAALRTAVVASLYRMLDDANLKVVSNIIWQAVITIVILIAEAVTYWILRRRFYRMSWIWTHVVLLYIVLLILPLVYVFLSFVLPRYLNPELYADWLAKFSMAQITIYWVGLAIAHVFFVLTIVYGFQKKKLAEPVGNEPTHILDQFTE